MASVTLTLSTHDIPTAHVQRFQSRPQMDYFSVRLSAEISLYFPDGAAGPAMARALAAALLRVADEYDAPQAVNVADEQGEVI